MADQQPRTKWHQLFGYLLQELLTPVGLTVHTELQTSSDPPKIDIIIIKSESEQWTPEQRDLLPDGIRDSQAQHILLEFKYTESLNVKVIHKILGYEALYQESQKLSKTEVQSFLVISKTPQAATLTRFGYHPTSQVGVYQSDNVLLTALPVLVLNKLSNEGYNIYFKLFASRLAVKQEAITVLREKGQWQSLTRSLQEFLKILLTHWFVDKGDDEMLELTPEQMIEASKAYKEYILPFLSLEERLTDVSEDELSKIPLIHHIEEKGRQEGERKATLKALHRTLTIRFEVVPGEFNEKFEPLDLKLLEQLSEVALTVQTLAEFEKALAEMVSA